MGADLFAFLTAASPWWWVALAVAIGVVEMLTFTYYLIWIASAAIFVALVKWVSPEISGQTQLILFALSSLLTTILGHYGMKAYRRRTPEETGALNRRSDQLVGRTGLALEDFVNGEGQVIIDDIRWTATLISGAAQKGDSLKIINADGMRVQCEPLR